MSKPYVYYWAPSVGSGYQDGIAKLQSPAAGTNFTLVNNIPNGGFSYANTLNLNTTNNDINADLIRSVNITSVFDNIGVKFVISGIGSPVDSEGNPTQVVGPISEELDGINNGTITSANIYMIITSIAVANGFDATGVSVGYGSNGITNYYMLDCNRTPIQGGGTTYTIQVLPNPTTTLGNTVFVSLNKPQSPNINGSLDPFGFINNDQVTFIPGYAYQADSTPSDTSYFKELSTGFQVIWVNVADTGSDSLFFTIMQQGIT